MVRNLTPFRQQIVLTVARGTSNAPAITRNDFPASRMARIPSRTPEAVGLMVC